MHIVHLIPQLFGPKGLVGGAERYAFELARNMAEEEQTTLVSFGDRDDQAAEGKLNIVTIGQPWHIRGQAQNPFAFKIFKHLSKADVIHCHQTHILLSSISALYGMISNRRIFTSDLGGGGWDISAYISTKHWYKGHLHISKYSEKISGDENLKLSHVIYGGVDCIKFSPGTGSELRKPVVYTGRILPHKGVNYLIEALPEDMSLRIIGKPYHDDYFEMLKKLANGKNVIFETNCDDAALVRAYQEALCVVLPSVYRDCYGNESQVPELLGQTLLEGMACGVPVICSDVASMPEIVSDSKTGFIVPPNNPDALRQKLIWLRDHPQEANQIGIAARQVVTQQFNWKSVVSRCLEIYKKS